MSGRPWSITQCPRTRRCDPEENYAASSRISRTCAAFSAALQRRRRGVPVRTSIRRKLCPSIGKLLGKPASLSRLNETGSSDRPYLLQDGSSAPLTDRKGAALGCKRNHTV